MRKDARHKTTWAVNIVLLVVSLLFSLLAAKHIWASREKISSFVQRPLEDDRGIGIFQSHPQLGWELIPNSIGSHKDPELEFDVTYRVDSLKHRVTPAPYNRSKIVFLGGSFTFGHGVDDAQVFSYLLQKRMPNTKIINAAVQGWGTAQAYLKLQQLFNQFDDIETVVYGYIADHNRRNFLRKEWLELLLNCCNRLNPYYYLENDKLIFGGLAPLSKGVSPSDYADLASEEQRITDRLILALKKLVETNGARFMLVFLPDRSSKQLSEGLKAKLGSLGYLDLRPKVFADEYFYSDHHPKPSAHKLIAEELEPKFRTRPAEG